MTQIEFDDWLEKPATSFAMIIEDEGMIPTFASES